MAPELRWLTYTALLAGSLWIPYIIGVNVTDFPGKTEQFVRPPDHRQMPPWVHRSLRVHQNLLEQLLPFAVVVLVGATSHISTPITVACAIGFFWLRVAHAIVMLSGRLGWPLRPILYFAGWILMLVFAWQILANSAAAPP